MDVSQYLEIFIDETKEHLQSLNEQLLILEKEPENTDTINEIFRAAHSLKGMAGTMGYKRMQRLTHDMENVFSEIRNGRMKVSANLVDVLFKGLDALENYLANIQNSTQEGTEDNDLIINQLNQILKVGIGKVDSKTMTTTTDVEENKAKQSEYNEKEKYRHFHLFEHEIHACNKAIELGLNVVGITVYIQETCILKAARAFLIFKSLEELGEVIKSEPEVQDIEDEKFEFEFSLIFITKEKTEKVKACILRISEVKEVYVDHFKMLERVGQTQEEKIEELKSAKNKEASSLQVASGKKTINKQQNQKPVVNRSVRVDIEKLDVLMNLVSELIIAKNGLVSISSTENTSAQSSSFNEQIEYLERVTTNLHESVMKVRMVPIESVVNRFPRMIRDLSKKLNKKMELFMTGEDTELDRTVIDEIGDPLMHLLRNAADHGLESNDDRKKTGKAEAGSIYLDAYQDGNNVVIEVRDDGAGINTEKVKSKAIECGILTEEQAASMSQQAAIELLYQPSFSTAEKISDVSGRGVGLDVVKTKIESLGGELETKTVLGAGSTFTIRLPLTLAIIQGLMVDIGSEKYAIPLGSIETIEDVGLEEIKYIQTKEVIHLRGKVIPLLRLANILDVELIETTSNRLTVVIVSKGERRAGLIVDNLIGQQEIVIKSIGKYINNNKIIGGATILGDGEVALILDVNTLV